MVREVGYTSREDSVSMIFDFSKVHEKENRKGKKKENKFANKKGFFLVNYVVYKILIIPVLPQLC